MKDDAFDDLRCPFNYKAELKRVRRGLNEKVGRYISENPQKAIETWQRNFTSHWVR